MYNKKKLNIYTKKITNKMSEKKRGVLLQAIYFGIDSVVKVLVEDEDVDIQNFPEAHMLAKSLGRLDLLKDEQPADVSVTSKPYFGGRENNARRLDDEPVVVSVVSGTTKPFVGDLEMKVYVNGLKDWAEQMNSMIKDALKKSSIDFDDYVRILNYSKEKPKGNATFITTDKKKFKFDDDYSLVINPDGWLTNKSIEMFIEGQKDIKSNATKKWWSVNIGVLTQHAFDLSNDSVVIPDTMYNELKNDIVFFVLHKGVHWGLIAFYPKFNTMVHYDSLGVPPGIVGQNAFYAAHTFLLRGNYMIANLEDIILIEAQEIMQSNGSDCGAFVCYYIGQLIEKGPIARKGDFHEIFFDKTSSELRDHVATTMLVGVKKIKI